MPDEQPPAKNVNGYRMKYLDIFNLLHSKANYTDDRIELGNGLVLRNFDFRSRIRFPLPESAAEAHALPAAVTDDIAEGIHRLINKTDAEIEENLAFRYHIIMPDKQERARNVIFLFHGFNEKYWSKYMPWAFHLAANTGKAVVMFPIAFHMNRAPALWSEARSMHKVSRERKQRYPALLNSSLSNVAISTRLHNKPERFIWSGLESYYDVLDLVESIKQGRHPAIEEETGIDFCSYSIGTFLGEIIMMTNKNGYFSNSRYAAFCGGPVFNRLSPVSKFILDSEANVRLYSYLVEHIDSHMKTHKELGQLFSGAYDEGVNLRCLLNYRTNLEYREDKFRAMKDRFYAIALAKDEVVPPYEVVNTLQGSRMDVGIRVDVLDYPYAYRHEDPFPPLPHIADEVDRQFRITFDRISEFLGKTE